MALSNTQLVEKFYLARQDALELEGMTDDTRCIITFYKNLETILEEKDLIITILNSDLRLSKLYHRDFDILQDLDRIATIINKNLPDQNKIQINKEKWMNDMNHSLLRLKDKRLVSQRDEIRIVWQQDAHKEAAQMLKIMISAQETEWENEMKITPFIQNLVQTTILDKKEENKLNFLKRYTMILPKILQNHYIMVSSHSYMKLLEELSEIESSDKGLSSTEFETAAIKAVNPFVKFLKTGYIHWTKFMNKSETFTYIIGEKTYHDKYEKALIEMLSYIMCTIKYGCQYTFTDYVKLTDYPFYLEIDENTVDDSTAAPFTLIEINLKKINDSKLSIRLQAKIECERLIRERWEKISSSIGAKRAAHTASGDFGIPKEMETKFKTLVFENMIHLVKLYFDFKLDRSHLLGISLLQQNVVEMINTYLQKINLDIDEKIFLLLIDTLKKYVLKLPKEMLEVIYEDSEEAVKEEPIGKQAILYNNSYARAPYVKSINSSRIINPPRWVKEVDLYEHISTEVLLYLTKSGVCSNLEKIKSLFYIFDSDAERQDFNETFLNKLNVNSEISEEDFELLIQRISSHFDKLNCHNTEDYRNIYFSGKSDQRKGERLSDYMKRLTRLQHLAFPSSYNLDTERLSLVKKWWRGLYDRGMKQYLFDKHNQTIYELGQPKEILKQANQYEILQSRLKAESDLSSLKFEKLRNVSEVHMANNQRQSKNYYNAPVRQDNNYGRNTNTRSYRGTRFLDQSNNNKYNQGSYGNKVSWSRPGQQVFQNHSQEKRIKDYTGMINDLGSFKSELSKLTRNKNVDSNGFLLVAETNIPDYAKKSKYYSGPGNYVRNQAEYTQIFSVAYQNYEAGNHNYRRNTNTPTYSETINQIRHNFRECCILVELTKKCITSWATFDSGATSTVISKKMFDELNIKGNMLIKKSHSGEIFSANGDKIRCYGKTELTIKLGMKTIIPNFEMLILDIKDNMLLGTDLMSVLVEEYGGFMFAKQFHHPNCNLFGSDGKISPRHCNNYCQKGTNCIIISPLYRNKTDYVNIKMQKNIWPDFGICQVLNDSEKQIYSLNKMALLPPQSTELNCSNPNEEAQEALVITKDNLNNIPIVEQHRILEKNPKKNKQLRVPIINSSDETTYLAKNQHVGCVQSLENVVKSRLVEKDNRTLKEFYTESVPSLSQEVVKFPVPGDSKIIYEFEPNSDVGIRYGSYQTDDPKERTETVNCKKITLSHQFKNKHKVIAVNYGMKFIIILILLTLLKLFKQSGLPEIIRSDNQLFFRNEYLISALGCRGTTLEIIILYQSNANVVRRATRTVKHAVSQLGALWKSPSHLYDLHLRLNVFRQNRYKWSPHETYFIFKPDKNRLIGIRPGIATIPVQQTEVVFASNICRYQARKGKTVN